MLQGLLTVLFVTVMAMAVLVANAYFWWWLYASSTSQDETHYVRTEDGLRLALHRYRPDNPENGLPVVLCHGLGSNRYSFDLPGAPSLAEFLKARGFDVWVPELRGSGMSDRPGLFRSDVPNSWGFDDHLRYDVPAIIVAVLRVTGAPSLHWVGHSMGGMLILAHLGSDLQAPVASAATLGSPLDCSRYDESVFQSVPNLRMMLRLKPLPKICPIMIVPFCTKLFVPIAHRVADRLLAVFRGANITPEVASKVLALCSEIVTPSRLWLNLGRYIETGRFGVGDGTEHVARLQQSPVPILMLGGGLDALVPAEIVDSPRARTTAAGERACAILGKETGCEEDYGHMDLLVGTRASEEVFPRIVEWITLHDSARG